MSTYLYTYASYSKRTMIAKYEYGNIYDCRKSTYESTAPIIAKEKNGYLCRLTRTSYEFTDIYVVRDVAYKKRTTYTETILLARNGIIYSYENYSAKKELATYFGDPKEALLAYAALYIMKGTPNHSNSGYSSGYTNNSTNSSSESSGGMGDGCMTVVIFAGLFIFAAIIMSLIEYFPYYTYAHIAIPTIVLLIVSAKRIFSDKDYDYNFGNILLGGLKGALGGFIAIVLTVLIFDMGINNHMKMGRELIISYDTAYTWLFILSIIIGIVLSGKEKK